MPWKSRAVAEDIDQVSVALRDLILELPIVAEDSGDLRRPLKRDGRVGADRGTAFH